MIIYSVACQVDKDVAEKWEQYFIETHLDDVYNSGCFTGYSFRKETENVDGRINFVSEYYCTSMANMEEYNAKHAAALKQDIMDKFGGKFSASRRFFEVIGGKLV